MPLVNDAITVAIAAKEAREKSEQARKRAERAFELARQCDKEAMYTQDIAVDLSSTARSVFHVVSTLLSEDELKKQLDDEQKDKDLKLTLDELKIMLTQGSWSGPRSNSISGAAGSRDGQVVPRQTSRFYTNTESNRVLFLDEDEFQEKFSARLPGDNDSKTNFSDAICTTTDSDSSLDGLLEEFRRTKEGGSSAKKTKKKPKKDEFDSDDSDPELMMVERRTKSRLQQLIDTSGVKATAGRMPETIREQRDRSLSPLLGTTEKGKVAGQLYKK